MEHPASFGLKSDGRLSLGILDGAFDSSGVFAFGAFGPKLKQANHAATILLALPPKNLDE